VLKRWSTGVALVVATVTTHAMEGFPNDPPAYHGYTPDFLATYERPLIGRSVLYEDILASPQFCCSHISHVVFASGNSV